MADGINGPMIIHSPRDPLKRSVDFDHEVVLMLTDWYHKLRLSGPFFFGTINTG
jgi:FtsP/CotA-like multicopper oxidase with cupredoxin domain